MLRNIIRRIKGENQRLLAQQLGFEPFAFQMAIDALKQDVKDPAIPWSRKVWAWRRGFTAQHACTFSIDETNYHQFVPTLAYYRMHPINGVYGRWIDDKLTFRYLLAPFAEYLPRYYFQIEGGGITHRLMDCPAEFSSDTRGIIDLLDAQGELALKPVSGSLAEGFHHAVSDAGNYSIDSLPVTREEAEGFVEQLRGYLVMEYIRAHPTISAVFSVTPNTMRLQVIRPRGGQPQISSAFIRFGSTTSGVRESPTVGGVVAKLDLETGEVTEAYSLQEGLLVPTHSHPDSGHSFALTVPRWPDTRRKILEVSDYIPQVEYAGYDVVITQDAFKILEINSLSSPGWFQFFYPPLSTSTGRAFFAPLLHRAPIKLL